jgi:hypothetical protein
METIYCSFRRAVVVSKKGVQVNIPADTPFEIRLKRAVEVPSGAYRA